jgi:hypothetical protein
MAIGGGRRETAREQHHSTYRSLEAAAARELFFCRLPFAEGCGGAWLVDSGWCVL